MGTLVSKGSQESMNTLKGVLINVKTKLDVV